MVTFLSRPASTHGRWILNEHDIARYVLARYNVTLRVSTLEVCWARRDTLGRNSGVL